MIFHGVAGLTVASATAVAADHSIAVAIITAASGLAVVIAAQIGSAIRESVKSRRHRRQTEPVDHYKELIAEQTHLVEHLIGELERRDQTIAALQRRDHRG